MGHNNPTSPQMSKREPAMIQTFCTENTVLSQLSQKVKVKRILLVLQMQLACCLEFHEDCCERSDAERHPKVTVTPVTWPTIWFVTVNNFCNGQLL